MPTPDTPPRQLACARCGTTFECRLRSACWCAEEAFRLPMRDEAGEDCLCPACLRAAAARGSTAQQGPR